jgi:hypothetical protein
MLFQVAGLLLLANLLDYLFSPVTRAMQWIYCRDKLSLLSERKSQLGTQLSALNTEKSRAAALNSPATFTEYALAERKVTEMTKLCSQLQSEISQVEREMDSQAMVNVAKRVLNLYNIVSLVVVKYYWNVPCGYVDEEYMLPFWGKLAAGWPIGTLHVSVLVILINRVTGKIMDLYKTMPKNLWDV